MQKAKTRGSPDSLVTFYFLEPAYWSKVRWLNTDLEVIYFPFEVLLIKNLSIFVGPWSWEECEGEELGVGKHRVLSQSVFRFSLPPSRRRFQLKCL